jgi:hypothetical protein
VSFRPAVEALEERSLLSTFNWWQTVDGTFGDSTRWHDQNGLTGLPGSSDDATIPNGINVTTGTTRTLNTLNSSANLELTAGTFVLKNIGHTSTLSNLIVDSGATLEILSGTTYISGCTIAGTLDVEPGATLDFLHGDNNLNPGTSLTGTGQFSTAGDVFGGPGIHLNTNITAPTNFLLQNGVIDGTGTLTIAGTFNWISAGSGGASMAGTGVTNIAAGATLHIGGINSNTLDTRTINNSGTVNWDGTAAWNYSNGVFNNLAGGTFNAQSDENVGFGGTFNNAGTFTKTSPVGTGTTFFDSVFNNTGTVSVQSGVLQLNRGGLATGSFSAAAGGQLLFSGNIYTLNSGATFTGQGQLHLGGADLEVNGNVTMSNLTFDTGTLGGSAALGITGTLSWTGGQMSGTGSTLVQTGGLLNLSGPNDKNLTGRTLSNGGAAAWSGTGNFQLSSIFNNLAGATFTIQTDATVGSGGIFNNSGTFTKTSPVGTGTTFFDAVFNNLSTVLVQNGVLKFNRGGTGSGNFNVASTGQLQFVGNTYTLNTGATITGVGSTRVSGGQLTLAGNASAVNLGLDQGTLGGAATLTVTGSLDWTGGQINDSNGIVAMPAGSALLIHGNNDKSMNSGTLNLAGAATWQDSGNLDLGGNATLNIQNGGSFTINNAQTLGGPATINNAGTITKTGSPGTTSVSFVVSFNNNGGVVQVQTGTLSFGTDYVQNAGGMTIAAGAALAVNGTARINGGVLLGAGTISGKLTNAGTITPGTQTSAGLLTLNGDYTQTSTGILNLKIGGTSAGTQYDQLKITGAANLGGAVNVSVLNNFVPTVGTSFAVLACNSRTGTFAIQNGLTQGTRHYDANYVASGLNLFANATDLNQRFIVHLYADVLSRAPDQAGLIYWSSALTSGAVNRYQITQAFTHSLEYRIDEVFGVYAQVLHRTPDAVGLTASVNYLQGGGFVEQLAAVLAGSPEYLQTRGGGTVDGFLGALYQDALGRPLDGASKTAWEQAMAHGVTQAQAATAVYSTLECDMNTVSGFYQKFLHRPADSAGLNALAGAIAHGSHDEDVLAVLLSTDEYYNRS